MEDRTAVFSTTDPQYFSTQRRVRLELAKMIKASFQKLVRLMIQPGILTFQAMENLSSTIFRHPPPHPPLLLLRPPPLPLLRPPPLPLLRPPLLQLQQQRNHPTEVHQQPINPDQHQTSQVRTSLVLPYYAKQANRGQNQMMILVATGISGSHSGITVNPAVVLANGSALIPNEKPRNFQVRFTSFPLSNFLLTFIFFISTLRHVQ